MAAEPERYERMFAEILSTLESPDDLHARAIIQALEIVTLELNEIGVAVDELRNVDNKLSDIIHHLEKIDGHTMESAALARKQSPARK